MGDVVFVKTLHNYDHSYFDLWKLVELSGYPMISIADVPREGVKDVTYIVTPINYEWEATGIPTDGRVIAFDLELRREPLPPIPNAAEMWTMDKGQSLVTGARYVPIGSHPGLEDEPPPIPSYPSLYDVALFGVMIPRRAAMRHALIERGLKLTPEPNNTFRDNRFLALTGSRAYVMPHQWDDVCAVPGLRMAVAAAYSIPVIMERVPDAGIFTSSFMLTSDYQHLADFTAMWVKDERGAPVLREFGRGLHNLLCERYTFRKMIEANV